MSYGKRYCLKICALGGPQSMDIANAIFKRFKSPAKNHKIGPARVPC